MPRVRVPSTASAPATQRIAPMTARAAAAPRQSAASPFAAAVASALLAASVALAPGSAIAQSAEALAPSPPEAATLEVTRPPTRPWNPEEAIVNAATDVLRFISPDERDPGGGALPGQPVLPPVAPGRVDEVAERIATDFVRGQYFVTGRIDGAIYDDDCLFEDPTVEFNGLQRWRSNLRLLVPFLVNPRVDLLSGPARITPEGAAPVELRAEWRLITGLNLPWHPLVDVRGNTTYQLAGDGGRERVVRHTEAWETTGREALLQIFKPGPPEGGLAA
ncbi:unnamed protein product [Pedinophyceae sp. YPF-701]|nr:unnamed protein product [Pedinophyceae sp. YPF-701]